LHAGGGVLKAGGVAKERINAVGRVEAAGGVADKGIDTGGRILGAADIVEQGAESDCTLGTSAGAHRRNPASIQPSRPDRQNPFSIRPLVVFSEEMSIRLTIGSLSICWPITLNRVDRQTGIITC